MPEYGSRQYCITFRIAGGGASRRLHTAGAFSAGVHSQHAMSTFLIKAKHTHPNRCVRYVHATHMYNMSQWHTPCICMCVCPDVAITGRNMVRCLRPS